MNILVISPTAPLPANNGARLRIFNFVKHLSRRNAVTLLMLTRRGDDAVAEGELAKYCRAITAVSNSKTKPAALLSWLFSGMPYRHVKMHSPSLAEAVRSELEHGGYDVVLCNFLDMAQHLEGAVRHERTVFVIDQHNADELWFESFSKSGSPLMRYFGRQNIKRLRRVQGREYGYFDLCLSVSEKDAEYTRRVLGSPLDIAIVPNGVDTEGFAPREAPARAKVILFCGSMDTTMNQDAVLYFYREIFPVVTRSVPDARFVVVGRSPPRRIRRLEKDANVTVTGTVDDVTPFYAKAAVMVAPFRLGGGTKLKILEAMAMKVPVVSTSVGCQGIEVDDNRHVLISDDTYGFSERVVEAILRRPGRLLEEAYALVSRQYSWRSIVAGAEHLFVEMAARKKPEGTGHGGGRYGRSR